MVFQLGFLCEIMQTDFLAALNDCLADQFLTLLSVGKVQVKIKW